MEKNQGLKRIYSTTALNLPHVFKTNFILGVADIHEFVRLVMFRTLRVFSGKIKNVIRPE